MKSRYDFRLVPPTVIYDSYAILIDCQCGRPLIQWLCQFLVIPKSEHLARNSVPHVKFHLAFGVTLSEVLQLLLQDKQEF